MNGIRKLVRNLMEEASGTLNHPYSINYATYSAIRKNIEMIHGYESAGSKVSRRRFLTAGLVASLGVAYLALDFLYGGPIKNVLYPQNTTRGQEMTSITEMLTEPTSEVVSTSSQTYMQEGRLFFNSGTSQYGTAGNGIQNDPDIESGQANITVAFVDPTSGEVAATATTDSAGDFKAYLPKGNFHLYQFSDEFPYMCQSVKEVSRVYNITIGENNPKLSIGLLNGVLSFPERGIDIENGGYYDRDPRVGYTLTWNGVTGQGPGQSGDSWSGDSGTHFLADEGDIIRAFAPGFCTYIQPNADNFINFSIVPTLYNTLAYPHFEFGLLHSSELLVGLGDPVARYQPVAKAGHVGYRNTVVHLQLGYTGGERYSLLDPYEPTYPIDPKTYGCWSPPPNSTGIPNYLDWLSLPVSQKYNWDNYWIVKDQTHF